MYFNDYGTAILWNMENIHNGELFKIELIFS